MRIAVNAASLLQDSAADNGNVATEILFRLCSDHPEHQFILITDRQLALDRIWPEHVSWVVLPLTGSTLFSQYRWREWSLPKVLKAQRAEMLLGMNGSLPLRSKLPGSLLIRDLSFLHGVAGESASAQRRKKQQLDRSIRAAQRIAVVSQYLVDDLRTHYPTLQQVERVVPAVPADYRPLEWEEREAVKRAHAGGVEYFIAVGSMHPRNNILPLLKAFSFLKKRHRSNMKLVLVGRAMAAGAELIASLESYRFRQDVVWLKEADHALLAQLIGGAYALVHTARFDGLAMPILYAGACQVPVIAIDSAAAREAGGEAALYCNPAQLEELADNMARVYKDETLRNGLLQRISPHEGSSMDVLLGR
ncbi:glycosyltransferase [Chitinophaga pendula]|uniref:glycosyltransferase n=1 Tax=Chitinophaga TaxID=79328 RepID=UPI000BB0B6CD|nr:MULTISPECIES: glycosyltransferase [Chitinophaga]ASZ10640.1 hypothetical protein CK934_06440 [Chitinophaga sp. MD30]UCJ06383.1 glycosyltransferase [Chitinophaga pendula]